MYCSNCGKQIDDDSVFCEFCGTKVDPAPVNVSDQSIVDLRGVSSVNGDSNCMQPQSDSHAAPGNMADTGSDRKKGAFGIIIIVAAAVILIVIIALWIAGSVKTGRDAPPPPPR